MISGVAERSPMLPKRLIIDGPRTPHRGLQFLNTAKVLLPMVAYSHSLQ